MISTKHFFLLFSALFFSAVALFAQEKEEPLTDDLGDVSDAFKENFFEALKQKGIENYELAYQALQKAEKAAKKDPDSEAVVFFEMAKNLIELKRYSEAEEKLNKAFIITGEKPVIMETFYNLYYTQKKYKEAIPWVEKLAKTDEDYKEDLANLFRVTKQYDKAITLLDQLDETRGDSYYRDSLRQQIYNITGDKEGAITNLEKKIDKNSTNEKDYINLIYLYSKEGNTQKAFEVAQELIKQQPNNEKAHLALYKYYIEKEAMPQAVSSLEILLPSNQIITEVKVKVLQDFLNFIEENPQYQQTIEKLIPLVSNTEEGAFYEALGAYYLKLKNPREALVYFEKGNSLDPDNFSLLKHTLLLQIDEGKYAEAAVISENALAIFPAQALLYLLNGVANNILESPDKAIESLEMGIDFLLDDPKMGKDFYLQLVQAYSKKGDTKKASLYQEKASAIKIAM